MGAEGKPTVAVMAMYRCMVSSDNKEESVRITPHHHPPHPVCRWAAAAFGVRTLVGFVYCPVQLKNTQMRVRRRVRAYACVSRLTCGVHTAGCARVHYPAVACTCACTHATVLTPYTGRTRSCGNQPVPREGLRNGAISSVCVQWRAVGVSTCSLLC